MNILFDKILPALIYPLGFALFGLAISFAAVFFNARRTALVGLAVSAMLLWIFATPIAAHLLARSLEGQYQLQVVEDYAAADVAIVLGGGVAPQGGDNPYVDLRDGSDRVLHALRIYKAGKVRSILITGGDVFGPGADVVEADAILDLLVALGVDRSDILLEQQSRNTYENARFSAEIWKREGFRSGLLVTSALHMPRALATFRKAGMVLEPATTDLVPDLSYMPMPLPLIPQSKCLDVTTNAIKEWIGLLIYRWRGWA